MNKYFSLLLYLLLVNFGYGQVNTTFRTSNNAYTIVTKDIYKVLNSSQSKNKTTQVGAPQLPVTTQSFVLPAGAVVSNLSVVNGSKIQMGGVFTYLSNATTLHSWQTLPRFCKS